MTQPKKIAIVFPGQGSQSIGMLSELAKEYPSVSNTFAEASEALGYDLWDLTKNGPEKKLNQTEYTQPALLAADIAVWQIWQNKCQTSPAYLAGHSLGEYAALVAAEVLPFATAIKIVQLRGHFMQRSYHGRGAMVAVIGLSDEQLQTICREAAAGQVLVPANYNSIGQVVLAGEYAAAERAVALAKAAGAKLVKLLEVSVPSHCSLMQQAADNLAAELQKIEFKSPTITLIHNFDVRAHSDPSGIKEALTKQLCFPVRWVETVQYFYKNGVTRVLECGPGKVLTGLNKRISSELNVDFLGLSEKLQGENICH